MASTMQQQVVAMNRSEATLQVAETRIDTITTDATVFDFENAKDGIYQRGAEAIKNIEQPNWSGFITEQGPNYSDDAIDNDNVYVVEYLGAKAIPGESMITDVTGAVTGGAVHTFRNTTRSAAGRSVVRMVQSLYVTLESP